MFLLSVNILFMTEGSIEDLINASFRELFIKHQEKMVLNMRGSKRFNIKYRANLSPQCFSNKNENCFRHAIAITMHREEILNYRERLNNRHLCFSEMKSTAIKVLNLIKKTGRNLNKTIKDLL